MEDYKEYIASNAKIYRVYPDDILWYKPKLKTPKILINFCDEENLEDFVYFTSSSKILYQLLQNPFPFVGGK